MTIANNENFSTILWYTGIVAVARYCNWCEIFYIIFSGTDIWSSFSFKMTYQFDGIRFLWISRCCICWTAFCDIICILHYQECEFVPGFKENVHWSSPSFVAAFRRMSDLEIRIVCVKVIFCLVLSMMGVFALLLLLLPDNVWIILSLIRMFSLKVVFSSFSFFISSSSHLIFVFLKFFHQRGLLQEYVTL